MKRYLILLSTVIPRFKIYLNSKNSRNWFEKNWEETYQFLNKSEFWNEKLKKKLNDNKCTDFSFYQEEFLENDTGINYLNNEDILFYAQSGGSSGPPKYFPITRTYLNQLQKTIPPFLFQMIIKFRSLFKKSKKILYLVSPFDSDQKEKKIKKGYISSFNYVNIPDFLANYYAIPKNEIESDKNFLNRSLCYALASDLSCIYSVTPASISSFMKELESNFDRIKKHLTREVLDEDLPIIEISRQRISFLKSFTGKVGFKTIWPNIEYICCWTTSICHQQMLQLHHHYGYIPTINGIYAATEGWMTVPLLNIPGDGGVVNLDSAIIEFVDLETDKIFRPWEVEKNQKYEILITNKMGLVRYRIGDIVLCTGFYHEMPIIEFYSKKSGELSLGNAVVSETNLVNIISKYFSNDDDFFIAPQKDNVGLHISSRLKQLSSKDLDSIDLKIQSTNLNYKKYRQSGGISRISNEILPRENNLWKEVVGNIKGQKKRKYLYKETI